MCDKSRSSNWHEPTPSWRTALEWQSRLQWPCGRGNASQRRQMCPWGVINVTDQITGRAIVSWDVKHWEVLVPSPEEPSCGIDVSGVGTLLDIARETNKGWGFSANLIYQNLVNGALPVVTVRIDGTPCTAVMDTGCTQWLVRKSCCQAWMKKPTHMLTADRGALMSCTIGVVHVSIGAKPTFGIEVLVVDGDLLGFDLLLGLDTIKQLGGVTVTGAGEVTFPQCDKPYCAAITITKPDFNAEYDKITQRWTASWKLVGDQPPVTLRNRLAEYPALAQIREEYERELQMWIDNSWLLPYPEDLGLPKGLISLMAIQQENKQKVQPVMDYRELNKYVDAYTANANVCSQKLREWWQQGPNIAVLDLRRAYLQVHVNKSLWPFQTVEIKGQRYCLTRFGFGPNVAPLIMPVIVNTVLSQDRIINAATSSYIDDIFVNESVCSAVRVKDYLEHFGLASKIPERLSIGTRVLGLCVWEEKGKMQWHCGSELLAIPDRLTSQIVFSVCEELTGHFPVCGWLHVAMAFVKRRANTVTTGWDDEAQDPLLAQMIGDIFMRVTQDDQMKGDWCISGQEVTVWVDTSSFTTGVVEESNGVAAKDASWLRLVHEDKHINLAELDAVLRGIKFALQ